MADKKLPPGLDPELANQVKAQDLLSQKTTDMSSARAARINSLHRSVEELTQEQNRKRMQVSDEVSSLTKQQQKMMDQFEVERSNLTSKTARAYGGVLQGLGRTINNLAGGVKSITHDTGKATSDAINQYGKAISEDISLNRTNTIAMALSTATPLFGYFAGKFMETDVFQSAVSGIKDKVKNAMSEGVSKASDAISSVFGRKKRVEEDIPQLHEGGYVKKGGMVEVHPAEVVVPVEKIFEQAKAENTKAHEVASTNIIHTFINEYKKAENDKDEKWQDKLLKIVEELKVGVIGMTSRIRIAWQRTLLKHPTIRNLLFLSDVLKSAIINPFTFMFGARGGYAGDVKSAMSTDNVFQKSANILSLIYTTLMPKIDNLVMYSRASAEAIVGEEISPNKPYSYSIFSKLVDVLMGKPFFALARFIKSSFFGISKVVGSVTSSISSISNFVTGGRFGTKKEKERQEQMESKMSLNEMIFDIRDAVLTLRNIKLSEIRRDSETSANIKLIAHATEVSKEFAEEQVDETRGVRKGLRGWGDKIWDIILLGFGMVKNIIGRMFGSFKSLLGLGANAGSGAIAGAIATKLFGKLKKFLGFGKKAGKAIGTKAGKIGTKAGKIGVDMLRMGRVAGGYAGRFATSTAGAIGGIAIGGGMGVWDLFKAIRDGDAIGFVGNWLIRGISGFLGGTDSGAAGAKRGAVKGGALGAAAGTFVGGPLGTAIGGAIGALIGGVLGFVGGKNISQAMSAVTEKIKKLAKGLWDLITSPFKSAKNAAEEEESSYRKINSLRTRGQRKFDPEGPKRAMEAAKARAEMSREEVVNTQTDAYLAKKEIEENKKNMDGLESKLSESINKTANETKAAIIQNTNVVSQTNNTLTNINNNGGRRGRNGRNFSSGHNFASEIIGANMN